MKLGIAPGKYIVAVSGGVDSAVLLDILSKNKELELVVAHFNHGIRDDSNQDEELVKNLAKEYDLNFESARGGLGKNTSEQQARQKRYEFLNQIKDKYKARAIITAHHQDDLLETALINMVRGTGHRGLTAIAYNLNILRPLLHYPKEEIINYAKQNDLKWHDDITNEEEKYLRNYIRKNVVKLMSVDKRAELLDVIENLGANRAESEELIAKISQKIQLNSEIDRAKFALLPTEVGNELTMFWLKGIGIYEFDQKTVERLGIAIRTAASGSKVNVQKSTWLMLDAKKARFKTEVLLASSRED